ncbi:MAG: hypothetical protein AAF581_03760 [Planctomycetota bacterium]
MRKSAQFVVIAMVVCVFSTSTALACHSDYFNEIFTKIERMKGSLNKDQIASLWDLNKQFRATERLYNQQGKPNRALDPHVDTFVAAAAGILDSQQFTKATGKKKTETQELRYEVNQLRKEIAEIKLMLKGIKAAKK